MPAYATQGHLVIKATTATFLTGYYMSNETHTHELLMGLLQLIGPYLNLIGETTRKHEVHWF